MRATYMNDLKNEIKRAVTGKGMIMAFLFAVAANIVSYRNMHKKRTFYKIFIAPYYGLEFKNDSYIFMGTLRQWTIFNVPPYYVYLMYLLPLVAVLPYASRIYFERRSGQIKNQMIRQSRLSYGIKKFISVYISGGLAVMLIPLVSLFMTFAICPYFKVNPAAEWSENKLYFLNPPLFILQVLLVWFVYGGALASISIVVSEVFDNLLTISATPLFLYLVLNYFEREEAMKAKGRNLFIELNPLSFLNAFTGKLNLGLAVMSALGLVNMGIYLLCIRKQDIL